MNRSDGHAALRRTLAVILALLTLISSFFLSPYRNEFALAEHLSTFLVASQLPQLKNTDADKDTSPFSLLTALAIHDSPLLVRNYQKIQALSQKDMPPAPPSKNEPNTETHEGTMIDPTDQTMPDLVIDSDNGVPAKTIHPTNPAGYLVWKDVYIKNTTNYAPNLEKLMSSRPAARFTDDMPQVLILHTHGTEAYTMPKGQASEAVTNARSHDTNYNVVRIGDEIANVFEEAGISVLHDRTLHDAAGYSDAYDRAEKAIAAYLKRYPSIHFVLDIHRDAIEDSKGNSYKVISQVNGNNAAQLSIVVGSDGSGLPHEHWQENLKLAVLLQQRLTEAYPTLMRPMYLRNSRYNEHATTGSLLVEVGAAGNSLDEAVYAARLFAEKAVEVFQSLA